MNEKNETLGNSRVAYTEKLPERTNEQKRKNRETQKRKVSEKLTKRFRKNTKKEKKNGGNTKHEKFHYSLLARVYMRIDRVKRLKRRNKLLLRAGCVVVSVFIARRSIKSRLKNRKI